MKRFNVSFVFCFFIIIYFLIAIVLNATRAEQVGDVLTTTFKGVIKKKPCFVNGGKEETINFGDIRVNRVDGKKYEQNVPFSLVCTGDNNDASIRFTVKGVKSDFDDSALKTNMDKLSIRITKNGTPVEINKVLVFEYGTSVNLKAVPLKKSGSELEPGTFTSSATLLAEYD